MKNVSDFGTVAQNITEARESPLLWLPGVDDYIQLSIAGTGTLASPTMSLWENGIDVSATKLSGAAMSIPSGSRTIKTRTLVSLVGGSNYKVYVYFTDGGVGTAREVEIVCPKLGINPSKYKLNTNKLRIYEAPILIYPGQSFNSQLTVDGQGLVDSQSMALYKGTTDDSSNSLSGSISVSGRTITLKTISSLSGGSEYLLYVYFNDASKPTCRYAEIICPKLGAY